MGPARDLCLPRCAPSQLRPGRGRNDSDPAWAHVTQQTLTLPHLLAGSLTSVSPSRPTPRSTHRTLVTVPWQGAELLVPSRTGLGGAGPQVGALGGSPSYPAPDWSVDSVHATWPLTRVHGLAPPTAPVSPVPLQWSAEHPCLPGPCTVSRCHNTARSHHVLCSFSHPRTVPPSQGLALK